MGSFVLMVGRVDNVLLETLPRDKRAYNRRIPTVSQPVQPRKVARKGGKWSSVRDILRGATTGQVLEYRIPTANRIECATQAIHAVGHAMGKRVKTRRAGGVVYITIL
jgi:hypothetical protein